MSDVEKIIAKTFLDIAEGLETGNFAPKPKIVLTGLGSELGEENAMKAQRMASLKGIDVIYIGTLSEEGVTTIKVEDEEEGHKVMEKLIESHEVDGAVTMHFPFPIGVSTVGRVITPALGKEMFIANTTGTSSSDRVEAMVKNAIYGIITAKACGISNPSVGILNVDGARQCEMVLNKLKSNGYDFEWAESTREDGGAVMRGNDLISGSADVMVMDSLTGNVMMKMFSSFNTGGNFEATGYGYGPGIGVDYEKLIMIISRASGAPVIANAIEYAAELVRGKIFEVAKAEFFKAEKAGLYKVLSERKEQSKDGLTKEVTCPEKEPVTASIPGIEVMDLDDAKLALWEEGIYAETGMGCTGPLVMMSEKNLERAKEIFKKKGYIAQ